MNVKQKVLATTGAWPGISEFESIKMIVVGDYDDAVVDISYDNERNECKLNSAAMLKHAVYAPKGIIVVHNHPSGNVTPSVNDDRATDRMIKMCEFAGIWMIDHAIVTPSGEYFSFADAGML